MELVEKPQTLPASPEVSPEDEQVILGEALVALRRAAACKCLPGHAAAVMEANVSLIEMFVDRPPLGVVR